ncbi:MAG: DNA adenine methylase [Gemmatimonadetes bacterium]|nr:DNA adenine methylase [Gemmatimonadota bacterium]
MRYIGNKTKLLGFIRGHLRRLGIRGGRAVDPFSGTASVARMLKEEGFQVVAGDIMRYAYLFARAYVELDREPGFSGLAAEVDSRSASGLLDPSEPQPSLSSDAALPARHTPDLRAVLRFLEHLEPEPGFIHEHYSPAGREGARHGRMYFTPENAARIDAIRAHIAEWHAGGLMDRDGHDVLVAALIEAADRVANTTGVYASFVKSWQPNALVSLRLRVPHFTPRNGAGPSKALRDDAATIVAQAGTFDLLYLDPPYNTRQYAGYYHIPELLAVGWLDGAPELRGKTGLIPDEAKRSDWSRRSRCETAFERLVAAAPCRWIVMSYNDEGIIRHSTIEDVLREYGDPASFRCYRRSYRRYRSDEDSEHRNYRGDRVSEYLYMVRKE